MDSDFPNEFDLVVVGTGFPESCVAAAASRIGKTVLHIDPNEFYGSSWASFNLEALELFLDDCLNNRETKSEIKNVSYKWHITLEEKAKMEDNSEQNGIKEEEEDIAIHKTSEEWTRSNILKLSRRFNIDLSPKILFSSGKLVELLISSNICRYAEFRAVDKVCTNFHDEVLNVPCSRTDVFNTKDLSIIEKRLLMKLLSSCVNYGTESTEDFSTFEGKPFVEYLQTIKLTDKIIHCVVHAIAMCKSDTTFSEGMERTKAFLESLGRYGSTPFLFPMYGCGEIPQCFCRLCAVFGGIYCLKKKIDNVIAIENGSIITLALEGKMISTKDIVISQSNISLLPLNIPVPNLKQTGNNLARGIIISSLPIGNEDLNSGGGGVNLLRLIVDNEESNFQRDSFLIQLSHFSGTCPKGLYLHHITAEAISGNPENDLKPFLKQVFPEEGKLSKILFSAFFTIQCNSQPTNQGKKNEKSHIYCTSVPFFELDYDKSISNANEIFSSIYPDAEFLPRAPDPEEIIIGDEDPMAFSTNHLPDDLSEQLKELEDAIGDMDVSNKSKDTKN